MILSERTFWRLVVIGFAFLAVISYLPALWGRVPFPRDVVLQFAAWNDTIPPDPNHPYANIGDLITAFYPARAFAARAVQEGTLPLWNPYLLSGAPFLASPQSSLFYPPNFLYYIVPLPVAWTLCLMLRVFMSALFMCLFVRRSGGSKAGSVFSGLAFALCGFMTAWQGQPMDDSATWLPLMCYAVLRLQETSSYRDIAVAALAFAMPLLAGHPETAAHVTLVAISIAVVTWVGSHFEFRFARQFVLAGVLAAGIASVQMIPTLEWLRQMPDALGATWPALPVHQFLAWVSRDIVRDPNSAGIFVPEAAAYLGMITVVLAPVGLLHRSKRHVWFLVIVTVAALAIAYGIEPLQSLMSHVPVLSGLKNSRMIFLASFGIAALAGLGMSVLEDQIAFAPRQRFIALILVVGATLLAFLLVYKLRLATEFRVEFIRRPSFSRAMLILALIPVFSKLYTRLSAPAFSIAACALLVFDLMTFSYGYMGFAEAKEIFPQARSFDFLKQNTDPSRFRITEIGIPYTANANLVYGIPSADGYEVRLTRLHRALSLDYTENRLDGISFTGNGLLNFNDRRLDLLNVKHLVLETSSPEFERFKATDRFSLVFNDGNVAAFENKTVLPRAFLVPFSGLKVLPGIDDQLAVLRDPNVNPQFTVTVTQIPKALNEPSRTASAATVALTSNVEMLKTSTNEVTLRYTSNRDSVLVLSQTYYPGWYAEVDGTRNDVFPVDVALTGAYAPAGLHNIRFVFRPNSFKWGATLTLISTIVIGLMLFKRPIEGKM